MRELIRFLKLLIVSLGAFIQMAVTIVAVTALCTFLDHLREARGLWPASGGLGDSFKQAVLVALIGAAVLGILSFPSYLKDRRLKKARAPQTAPDFAEYFSIDLVPEAVARQAYDYLQGLMMVRDFPVLPSDSLKIYGIDCYGGVPLSEVADDLMLYCGCREPTREEIEQTEPIVTVRDLVRCLSRFYTGTRR